MLTPDQAIQKVLIDQDAIQQRVAVLGEEISRDYAGLDQPLVLICILKGSFVFCADLMRQLTIPHEVHFMSVSSYNGGTSSSGEVKIEQDLDISIADRDVLIIEDIIDTGLTLDYLTHMFAERAPRSLALCTLLDKPEARQREVEVRYIGFSIDLEFVVGYGLDYDQQFRGLPYIAVLRPEVYQDQD